MPSEPDSMNENTLLNDPIMIIQPSKSFRKMNTPPVRSASPSFMDWIRGLWDRLGPSMQREGFSLVPVKVDHFGMRRVMKGSRRH